MLGERNIPTFILTIALLRYNGHGLIEHPLCIHFQKNHNVLVMGPYSLLTAEVETDESILVLV